MVYAYIFSGVSIFFELLDIIIGIKSYRREPAMKKFLSFMCFAVALVHMSYVCSVSVSGYRAASAFSSVYFIGMDIIVVLLLSFVIDLTGWKQTKVLSVFRWICHIYAVCEIILFTINAIGLEISISYIQQNDIFARYAYDMHPLYWCHLAFTYFCILESVILLILKAAKVPKEYRNQYTFIVYMIAVIVLINAVFLFIPKNPERIWTLVDYAIFTYSIAAVYCYWIKFQYSSHGMLNHLKSYVFENIDQGIILFDYMNHLLLNNEKSKAFLNYSFLKTCPDLDEFIQEYNIPLQNKEDPHTFQIYITGKSTPLRCDYRCLKNKYYQTVGHLFVFSDAALETDLITGFHNWESFSKFAKETTDGFPYPTAVGVCDINRMSVYNSVHGRTSGDQLIKNLSELMHYIFPRDSYFVRGQEAYLIVICHQKTEDEMKRCFTQIAGEFREKIQFSVSSIAKEKPDILATIETAITGLNAKKLLDNQSTHSAMLSSLVKALQESDPDTEAHVERTQKMGAELGKRIGLSDVDQSKLSLLCLLHDIGKIGVPLEILNKPGKLTPEEWDIIRSHVEKGYSIAMSTPELAGIADMIRYHHERWDGKGYPDGLSRESIPLLSRIISVVDAFDAMVNNRSYRKALTLEEAKEEIKRCAGTQFDPYIASEFLQYIENDYYIPSKKQSEVVPTYTHADQNDEEDSNNVHPLAYTTYKVDTNFVVVEIDDYFTELTGYTREDIKASPITQMDLIPLEDRTEYLCMVNAKLSKNPIAYFEHRLLCKDGSVKYVMCIGRKFFDSAVREERSEIIVTNSSNTYFAKVMANAMEDKAQVRLKHWEETYRKDSLTGLLSHVSFRSDIEAKLMSEKDIHMALIMMDIDKFKQYNDTYGHHAGDEFLILVAQSIQSALREGDLSCRMGGDEFAAAIFYSSSEDYRKIASDVFHKVNMQLKSAKGIVSLSMGVAVYTGDTKGFDGLYEKADTALYRSKDDGRNKITFA